MGAHGLHVPDFPSGWSGFCRSMQMHLPLGTGIALWPSQTGIRAFDVGPMFGLGAALRVLTTEARE